MLRLNFLLKPKMMSIFAPLVLGMAMSRICPIRTASPNNKSPANFPPPWLFGVAWTTIYLLFGLAWFKNWEMGSAPMWLFYLFLINMAANLGWIYTNNCLNDQKSAIYFYLPLFATLIPLIVNSPWNYTALCLSPYFTWLILAIILNYSSVFLSYKN